MSILSARLEALYETFDRGFLQTDPLQFPWRFHRPEDQEVVGFIAACLAYGRVQQIIGSVQSVLDVMGDSPHAFVLGFDPVRDTRGFDAFVHRFNRGVDVACLIYLMKQALERYGSLKHLFCAGYDAHDGTIRSALTAFVDHLLALECTPFYPDGVLPRNAGVRYFLPSPRDGSACKRLNLYLKWMVRRNDGLDLGIWEEISPSKLIMPVDTHVARIARYIGLTRLRSVGWNMAEEITQHLARLDPEDPVKYDFAISRLGILAYCPRAYHPDRCRECLIREICVWSGETEKTGRREDGKTGRRGDEKT